MASAGPLGQLGAGCTLIPSSRARPWKLAKAIGRLMGVTMPIAVRGQIRQEVKTARVAAEPAMTDPTVPAVWSPRRLKR